MFGSSAFLPVLVSIFSSWSSDSAIFSESKYFLWSLAMQGLLVVLPIPFVFNSLYSCRICGHAFHHRNRVRLASSSSHCFLWGVLMLCICPWCQGWRWGCTWLGCHWIHWFWYPMKFQSYPSEARSLNLACGINRAIKRILLQPLDILTNQLWGLSLGEMIV